MPDKFRPRLVVMMPAVLVLARSQEEYDRLMEVNKKETVFVGCVAAVVFLSFLAFAVWFVFK